MAAAAVTLLALAAQASTGTSDPVDISDKTGIRMTITARPDLGKDPEMIVAFDTGPTSSGPWTEIHRVQMLAGVPASSPYAWDSAKKVALGAVDKFLRCRWSCLARANSVNTDAGLTLGVAGTGILSA